MRRLAIYLGRWRLHQWLAYLAAEFPELGAAPCGYSRRRICMCNQLARRNPRWAHSWMAGRLPR